MRSIGWLGLALLVAGCASTAGEDDAATTEAAATQRQCSVLVVMSDEAKMTAVSDSFVTRGKTKDFDFGYLLDEMAIPVMGLLDAGCGVTFTDPRGIEPPRDPQGDAAFYFTDGLPEALAPGAAARAELTRALDLVDGASSPVRGRGPGSIDTPLPYDALVTNGVANASELSKYDAVFVPGGYSGMNHWNDARLGAVLRWFHENDRLTVTLCRGGVALRSTAEGGDFAYRGYAMTTYSRLEDDFASKTNGIKPLWDIPVHAAAKLEEAGGKVSSRPFKPHVVDDRDLLTGENQFSAHELSRQFVAKLRTRGVLPR